MKAKQKQIKRPVAARSKVSKPISTRAKVKHSAKKILVPHKVNQYRPHLIRAHGLTAVLVIALLAQTLYGFATTGSLSILGRVSSVQAAELLQYTNEERVASGMSELKSDERLNQAAYLKAQDMLQSDYWAHTSPSGVEPWKWFGDVEYSYSIAGENLAKNYPTSQATVQAWMDSPTHRENILNNRYADVGFAVIDGELAGQDTTLVVALYGSPANVATLGGTAEGSQPAAAAFTAAAVAGDSSSNPLAYFGSAAQSLSPVTIAILGLLAVVAIVAVVAHHNRAKLPKAWKKTWKAHHGMFTFLGMITLGVLIILASGGGQI